MTDINKVILVGNLTRDITTEALSSGTIKGTISIAVNRSVKKNDAWTDEVSFFDVIVWGNTATNLKPYLVKGQKIAVCGNLKQERWETNDGKKQSRVLIYAEDIQLVGARKEPAPNPNAPKVAPIQNQNINPNPYQNSYPVQNQQQTFNGGNYAEDVPF